MNRLAIKRIAMMGAFLVVLSAGRAESTPVKPPAFRMPTGSTKFENITFVVFDTETTGFSPSKDRLVEIGAVKIRNGENLGEKTWLINPERYIPWYVQQVHHITPEMVEKQPTFAEIYPEFLEFIDGSVLIAHNARFDIRFVAAEAERNGFPPPKNAVLDSLELFRHWYPELSSHTVGDLINLYQLPTEGLQTHRATDDSVFVYRAIQRELEERGSEPRFGELVDCVGSLLRFSSTQEH